MIDIKIEYHEKIIIMHMVGEFYMENVKVLDEIWNELIAKSPEIIALDCSKLNFIDSSAIGTLVKYLNSTIKKNIKMFFYDVNSSIKQIFKIAKLNKFFTITSKAEFESKYLSEK